MQAPSDVANRQWWENRLANTSFNDVALAVVEHNVGAGEQSAGNNLVGFRASTTWKNSRARETTGMLLYMYFGSSHTTCTGTRSRSRSRSTHTHMHMDERVAMIWCCFDGE